MNALKQFFYPLTVALALVLCQAAQAKDELVISDLSFLDRQYMNDQKAIINDLALRHFGSSFRGDTEHDIALLQRLLDTGLVSPQQTGELQAMGFILGDLLAQDLDLHWVIYADALGRSRALRYRETDNYLFPVTMISRRREVDNQTPVADIYQKAYDIMAEAKPPLPFQ